MAFRMNALLSKRAARPEGVFVGPVVDHAAGVGVVSREGFQHFAVAFQLLAEFAFDRNRAGECAEKWIDETLERTVLRLVFQVVDFRLEIGDLLLEASSK